MKSIYILFLLILFSAKISFAQDTLFMRNNTIILAKVLEVDAKEIKYNRFEVPNGPIYTDDKENINEIHYKNGLKDIFK